MQILTHPAPDVTPQTTIVPQHIEFCHFDSNGDIQTAVGHFSGGPGEKISTKEGICMLDNRNATTKFSEIDSFYFRPWTYQSHLVAPSTFI